mmetsp:Transcript_17786/g.35138  ORF Transcript_17786/g.35138 Transcript_17786/m.35138 type:complete len:83 (-) Transcript_17786:26-274(-)
MPASLVRHHFPNPVAVLSGPQIMSMLMAKVKKVVLSSPTVDQPRSGVKAIPKHPPVSFRSDGTPSRALQQLLASDPRRCQSS